MAKILTWRDEWTLRIDTLDDDHREIVDLLLDIARRFGEAPEHSEGSPESTDTNNAADDSLYDALNHFGAFARRHFRTIAASMPCSWRNSPTWYAICASGALLDWLCRIWIP